MRTWTLGVLAATGLMATCGCAAVQPSPASFSVRSVSRGDEHIVLEAAVLTLRDFGYRLDEINRAAGRLTTHPLEFFPDNAPRCAGTSSTSRRVAEILVESRDEYATVFCKVVLQRQTTETYRLLAPDQRGDDLPGRTPIEREAATEREHSTVWETVGRDKPQERAILSDIVTRVGPTSEAAD